MRTIRGALLALCCTACAAGGGDPGPGESVQAIAAALRDGRFELAVATAGRARLRRPDDPAVAAWSAVVADHAWQDDAAALALQTALRAGGHTMAEVADLRGRLGDLLFAAGRYGDAAPPLRAGAVGPAAERRRAFAEVARELPFRRRPAGPLLCEQALLPGEALEFVCGVGARTRPFALDTGTAMTTLTRTFAADLGVRALQPAGQVLDGTGRALDVAVGVVDDFHVGEIAVGSVPVLVVDDRCLELRDRFAGPARPPAGVLGIDLLSAFRLVVDPQRGTVALGLPGHLGDGDSIACVRADGRCLLPVTLDGVRAWFVLDTGASHSSLTAEGLRLLSGGDARAVPSFRRVHTAAGGTVSVREVRDLVLRAGDVRFTGVVLPVVARVPGALFPVHGVLGLDLLRSCRTTFERGRVRLEALP